MKDEMPSLPFIGSLQASLPNYYWQKNNSDHVHYYQGGEPFTYSLFDPVTKEFSQITLGPELHKGHKLQVCVTGGTWKCGIADIEKPNENNDAGNDNCDYCLIGEAVAPGFDFHDFTWITKEELKKTISDEKILEHFGKYIHVESTELEAENKTVDAAAEFYEDGDRRAKRAKLRA